MLFVKLDVYHQLLSCLNQHQDMTLKYLCTGTEVFLYFSRSEGILAQQNFGSWSPKCFNESMSDFNEMCRGMGFNKATYNELISPNSTVIAQDSFSSAKLNEQTIINIRKGRNMLEVDRNKECKHYYITCS